MRISALKLMTDDQICDLLLSERMPDMQKVRIIDYALERMSYAEICERTHASAYQRIKFAFLWKCTHPGRQMGCEKKRYPERIKKTSKMNTLLLTKLRDEAKRYAHIDLDGDFYVLTVNGVHVYFGKRSDLPKMKEDMERYRESYIFVKTANLDTKKLGVL